MHQLSKRILAALALVIFLTSSSFCTAQPYSTVVSFEYNKKKDRSEYTVLPFGNVILPGKWKKQQYDRESKQQWFSNVKDSLLVVIALTPCDRFAFNEGGSKTGFAFVKAYYDWEAEYFSKEAGLNVVLLEEDSVRAYRIMHVYGKTAQHNSDVYMLLSATGCTVRNFQLGYAPKLREEEKLAFLKSLLEEK